MSDVKKENESGKEPEKPAEEENFEINEDDLVSNRKNINGGHMCRVRRTKS